MDNYAQLLSTQADLAKSPERLRLSGPVSINYWSPSSMNGALLLNLNKSPVSLGRVNTISVKVQGDRVGVWLNGEEVGAIRISGTAKGKIGLHIEKGHVSKAGELCVREVLVQRLGEPEEKASTASQDIATENTEDTEGFLDADTGRRGHKFTLVWTN